MDDDPYGANGDQERDTRRGALLRAAESLLEEEGADALSVRRIADRSDVSTQIIYTEFGGKSGLLRALCDRAHERLASYLDEVPEGPPAERLAALGRAYRSFALDHPSLYRLMTGAAAADFEPPRAATDREKRSYRILEAGVRACVDQGVYDSQIDVREVADIHWAMVHGAVGIEIGGFYDDPETAEARFERALTAVAASFRRDSD
jgi:AcrR family transcriptional regulator